MTMNKYPKENKRSDIFSFDLSNTPLIRFKRGMAVNTFARLISTAKRVNANTQTNVAIKGFVHKNMRYRVNTITETK